MQQARFLDRDKLYILLAGTRQKHEKRQNIYELENILEYI